MSELYFTIAQTLHYGTQLLSNSDSAKLDCELLLLKVLNHKPEIQHTRTWLMTWPDTLLSKPQREQFLAYLDARLQGMPIAYILGEQDFWTLTLKVTAATLIPRPETELLVEFALEKIPETDPYHVLDLGTGSGAIALAIASERKYAQIIASDMSQEALNIAQENALALNIENISFYQSYWFNSIPQQQFDLIVSNPPYIAENDPLIEKNVKKYEPLTALYSNDNGLYDIHNIIKNTRLYLKPNGWILFEHGYNQKNAVQKLLQHYHFSHISTLNDLNHQPRVSMAQYIKN